MEENEKTQNGDTERFTAKGGSQMAQHRRTAV